MEQAWVAHPGWTALTGFLSAAELAAVRGDLDRLLAAAPEDRRPRDKPSAGTRHLVDVGLRIESVAEMLRRQELIEAVEAIIGDRYELMEHGFRCPQPGYGGQRLHADDVPKFDDGPDRMATAIVAFVDFDERNGSTRVVPGSHRRVDLQREAGRLDHHRDEIRLIGSAGTAFVFSGHLLHSGTRNDSAVDRPALQFVWRASLGAVPDSVGDT